jgi:hypothetical protein
VIDKCPNAVARVGTTKIVKQTWVIKNRGDRAWPPGMILMFKNGYSAFFRDIRNNKTEFPVEPR